MQATSITTTIQAFHHRRRHTTLNKPFSEHRHGHGLTDLLLSLERELVRTEHQPGWVLVVGSPVPLTKQALEKMGLAAHRILVLPAQKLANVDRTIRDALTCSTCQAVLTFVDEEAQLSDYEYLATKYQTRWVNHTEQRQLAH